MKITVDTLARTDLQTAWNAYSNPDDIVRWNTASPDWHSPSSTVDLREGGRFNTRMEARDGSAGFDFGGTYIEVAPQSRLAYRMDDGREATVRFEEEAEGVRVHVTFDAEEQNSADMQRDGWQAILDSFARHVEAPGL